MHFMVHSTADIVHYTLKICIYVPIVLVEYYGEHLQSDFANNNLLLSQQYNKEHCLR